MDEISAVLRRTTFFEGVRLGSVGLERLGGALTNVSYKMVTDAGAYVLRLAGEGTSDYVDRWAEGHNAWAAAVGINVEVLHFDTRDGTMVTRFVEGATMEGPGYEFTSGPDVPVRAALALGRIHRMRRVFRSRFDVFTKVRDYLDLLRELGVPALESCYELEREAEAARRALEASPIPLAPCHNDPWPGNFLDAGTRLYLIDWEYSGMNDPLWDLADLSVEAGFGPEQDHLMMEAYHGGGVPRKLYSRLELYKAMSDLHWALWGFVQHANGNPTEDFWNYALERLERCKVRMGSVGFGRHLSTVLADRQQHTKTRAYRTNPEWRLPSHRAAGSV